MDKNILYIGIELENESKEILKKKFGDREGWKVYCHHMTSVFNTKGTELSDYETKWFKENMGKKVLLIVSHYGENEKAAAVRVMCNAPCRNKVRHITLGTNLKNEGKPIDSNYILGWTLVEPLILVGTVKTWYRRK